MNLTICASRQNSMTTTQHSFNSHFPAQPWVSWYQNASIILDFIGAKDDQGSGDKWSYMTHKAPIISWPPTNQHAAFHCWDALPLAQQTVSIVQALNARSLTFHNPARRKAYMSFPTLSSAIKGS